MRLDDLCCALWLLDEEKGEKTLSPCISPSSLVFSLRVEERVERGK